MTKILIEAIFVAALAATSVASPQIKPLGEGKPATKRPKAAPSVRDVVECYETVYRDTYRPVQETAALVEMAGSCLRQRDGHLYYVGTGSTGLVGLVDVSRCFFVDFHRGCCRWMRLVFLPRSSLFSLTVSFG